jgi:hypothetical protein
MNKRSCFAAILLLALLAGGASVWEGSAVVGGSGDFPEEGLYAACNSFPRDASVEVRNLENGKVVTVVVTRNVDNPGVFIALSPKAAAELGMKMGSAARVRATTVSLSMADASLPAARAGETADPDFNPKVYVERDKTAAKAAAAPQAEVPAAEASPLPEAKAAEPPTAAPVATPAAPAPKASAPEPEPAVALIAEASAPPAAPAEKPTEAEAAAEAGAPGAPAEAAAPEAKGAEKVAADPYPLPPVAAAEPGQPKPESIGGTLPQPEPAPIPVAETAPTARTFPASLPELVGGSIPKPKAAAEARAYLPEPAAEAAVAEVHPEEGAASVEEIARPGLSGVAEEAALAEPKLALAPDELPEELLPRLSGPAPSVPDIALDEVLLPEGQLAAEGEAGPEAIAVERPALAASVAESGLEEPAALTAAEEGGPEALAAERPAGQQGEVAGLEDPGVPAPQESIAAESPAKQAGEGGAAALEEPTYAEGAQESGPAALAVETPSKRKEGESELGEPKAPAPTESLGVDRPAEGPVAPGEVVVGLEPTAPRPPVAAAPEAAKPAEAKPAAPPVAAAPTAPNVPAAPPAPAKPAVPKPLSPPASVPLVASLARGSYYVQIGVYGTNDSLDGAVKGFRSTYPLAVEKVVAKGGSEAYRLYVGPLSRDESGTALYRIKSMGYRDAFVKQGS